MLLNPTDKEREDLVRDLKYVNKFYLANPTPENIRAYRINVKLIDETKKEIGESNTDSPTTPKNATG